MGRGGRSKYWGFKERFHVVIYGAGWYVWKSNNDKEKMERIKKTQMKRGIDFKNAKKD